MEAHAPFDPHEFLTVVAEGRTVSAFKKNHIVFRQEDPADSVYFMLSGKVKLSVTSEQGKEAVVALLKPGDFIGECCLSGHRLRVSTATAMTDCKITRIAKDDIVKVIHEEPAFSEFFIAYLLARNCQTEADLVDQLFNSSEKRLARALLVLANYGKDDEPDPVLAKISQKTLAEMVGTTLPRINFFMNKFRRLGFIDYNGTITVHRSLLDLVLRENSTIHCSNSAFSAGPPTVPGSEHGDADDICKQCGKQIRLAVISLHPTIPRMAQRSLECTSCGHTAIANLQLDSEQPAAAS